MVVLMQLWPSNFCILQMAAPACKKVCCKGVAQGIRGGSAHDLFTLHSQLEGALKCLVVRVVVAPDTRSWIAGMTGQRKFPAPTPKGVDALVLAFEGVGQLHATNPELASARRSISARQNCSFNAGSSTMSSITIRSSPPLPFLTMIVCWFRSVSLIRNCKALEMRGRRAAGPTTGEQ